MILLLACAGTVDIESDARGARPKPNLTVTVDTGTADTAGTVDTIDMVDTADTGNTAPDTDTDIDTAGDSASACVPPTVVAWPTILTASPGTSFQLTGCGDVTGLLCNDPSLAVLTLSTADLAAVPGPLLTVQALATGETTCTIQVTGGGSQAEGSFLLVTTAE